MIQSFALEFENREDMQAVADKLWNKHGITGEMELVPLAEGRWCLYVHSEKQLRQSTIDGLPGKKVEGRMRTRKSAERPKEKEEE